jgi:hypothetical protein
VARRKRFWPRKEQSLCSPLKRSVPVSENAVSPVAPISSGFTFFFRGFFSRFRFSPGVGTPREGRARARRRRALVEPLCSSPRRVTSTNRRAVKKVFFLFITSRT